MKFGEYLKNQRTELGWTQPDAAAKAGIEQSYLSKLEPASRSRPKMSISGSSMRTTSRQK